MGDRTTNEIGDFQQKVVKSSSDINLVGSIVIGSIFGIIGLGLCIKSFIPKPENINCSGKDSDSSCEFNKDIICSVDKKNCYIKKRPYYLIIPGITMLGISGLIFYMYFWKKVYNKSLSENESIL